MSYCSECADKDREIASLRATLQVFQSSEEGAALLAGLQDAAAGRVTPLECVMGTCEHEREIQRLTAQVEKLRAFAQEAIRENCGGVHHIARDHGLLQVNEMEQVYEWTPLLTGEGPSDKLTA